MIIEVQELRKRMDSGDKIHLFDVREEWEWEEKNIGGTLMPLNSIPFNLDKLESLRHTEIVVFCKSGNRSQQARMFLESKGFNQVRSLKGGIEAFLSFGTNNNVS